MHHVIVYAEAGRFAGWPANNGAWSWDGREILVGFTVGGYAEQEGHNIVEPYTNLLARSRDGGDSWAPECPANYVGRPSVRPTLAKRTNLAAAGFAMRVEGAGYHGSENPGGAFYISDDRGETWQGPHILSGLGEAQALRGMELTSRTDYVVYGPDDCLVLMSARVPGSRSADRVFCARTSNGGSTFHFVSWMVPPADPYRAVMPSTVRCDPERLISAVRRRELGTERCWIDAYGTEDAGEHWAFLGTIGVTGAWNGNPPALVRLCDGRLCCVYGDRARRRIVACYSADGGASWHDQQVLRGDYAADAFDEPDLGYPRVTQRSDGKLVAIYYWATKEIPRGHIAATPWD